MRKIYIDGKSVTLAPKSLVGQGGEAEIYDIGANQVVKIFKLPDHPDYANSPAEQKAAAERIATHQQKLAAFPKNLPDHVVSPIKLATEKDGRIMGYTMPFLTGVEPISRYFTPHFRQSGINNDEMLTTLRHLHKNVQGIHKAGVVIGDFNDLNVLVNNNQTWLVDADSMQFGKFLCKLFTARFVDPLLCDPNLNAPMLIRPHNTYSDWYAYAMMVAMGFLLTDVWGGVFKPTQKSHKIPHTARSLHRITVWNPDVVYPKPARPYTVLPDDLMQLFVQTFEKDIRHEFPISLLDSMRWTTCKQCGLEHARAICPQCAVAAPAVKEVTRVRGKVTATRVFKTFGQILFATSQSNQLLWVVHQNREYRREDGSKILDGELDPQIRYRIYGNSTVFAKENRLMVLSPNSVPQSKGVETYAGTNLPVFDANEHHLYWIAGGQLMRSGGPMGTDVHIGDVLANQTLFWVGSKFGFGFYRAGEVTVGFVFDALNRGINDNVKIPRIKGQLLDSTCVFSNQYCWFFTTTQEGSNTINRVSVISIDGQIHGSTDTTNADGSWLGHIRGNLALGNSLYSATDDGIIRVMVENGKISVTQSFPDTEPFVDSETYLFPAANGIYAVSAKEVVLLKIG